jgi:hypothetical protein
MKCLPLIGSRVAVFCLLVFLMLPAAIAQSSPQLIASTEKDLATVRSVQVVPGHDGPAIEIIASRPLVPTITKAENPPRLVIDLPGTLSSGSKNRIDVQNDEISRLRVALHQTNPPVTRVVVELAKPISYTWDTAGNRLMVRLDSPPPAPPVKPPSVPAFTQGVQPAAVPLSSGTSGAVVLAASSLAPGSSVTAGSDTTILRLARGGEVRVCPGTTVSVTTSQNSSSLMLGMNTGAMEAHYTLDASADSILTPDFRVLLPGPGEFHYAISADSRGNTCVRALPGNAASVIVSELLGDGTYQVKPNEQIVFHSGRLSLADAAVPIGCGCPPPSMPVMRASATPALSGDKVPESVALGQSGDEKAAGASNSAVSQDPTTASQVKLAAARSETAPLPPSKPNEIHVQIDAPFVFRASDLPPSNPPTPAAPVHEAQLLPITYRSRPAMMQIAVTPPPSVPSSRPAHHGFFAKFKNFFSAIFS